MRKVRLYIAISIDGKIAKPDGSINWLDKSPNPEKSDFGYGEFISTVDAVLMGNKTYQEILGFDIPYPYVGMESYVFTRNKELDKDENVSYISENIPEFVRSLKDKEGGDIWLVGGGEVNRLLLEASLVDELLVYIMPIILGDGIPFVSQAIPDKYLNLVSSRSFPGGVVELKYKID